MKWRQATFQKKNNDSEDDPGSQQNNGKHARNAHQRLARTKEQTKMNNTLEVINSRISEAEECINDLEDRIVEITASEQNTEKNEKKK